MPTVSKVLKQLAKSEIVTGQRGAMGGYQLAKTPSAIAVVSIIEAMDGPIAITACTEGSEHNCQVEGICPMNGSWNKVNRAIRQALESVTLADMMGSPSFSERAETQRRSLGQSLEG